jgi:hypothetical protein
MQKMRQWGSNLSPQVEANMIKQTCRSCIRCRAQGGEDVVIQPVGEIPDVPTTIASACHEIDKLLHKAKARDRIHHRSIHRIQG